MANGKEGRPTAVAFSGAEVMEGPLDNMSGGVTIKLSDNSGGMEISNRSFNSSGGRSTTSSTGSGKSPSMRSNLTREHKDRDPEFYYDVVQVLGEGSMGRVAKVCKKKSIIGGSAYYNMKESLHKHEEDTRKKPTDCFQLPIFGGLFSFCIRGDDESNKKSVSVLDTTTATSKSSISSLSSGSANRSGHGNFSAGANKDIMLAMKSIHLKYITSKTMIEELQNEIAILKSLDHPNIVKVMETFDHNKQMFVVMELCSGGDLYTRDPYTEDEAARICESILSAVAYMHAHGVIHRDLKFENILFVNDSPKSPIKLIDFGLSAAFTEHDIMSEGAGTIYTMAPEVLLGNYTKQADLWSIGVIAFMLLSSQFPFHGKTRAAVAKKVVKGDYSFEGRRWQNVSNQGKAFIEELLVKDPSERHTAGQALRSTWLHRRLAATVRAPHDGELQAVKKSILRYTEYPKLRKLALMVVAHQSTTDQIGILRKVFQKYDENKEGTLNYDEFKHALYDVGFVDDDYRVIFDAVDIDGTGQIRYTEFLAATMEAAGWIDEHRLAEAFDRVDHQDTGFISKENLRHFFGKEFPDEELDLVMREAGADKRGISYANFMSQWSDDKEKFDSELRQWLGEASDIIDEVSVYKNPSSSDISVLSDDNSEARASFIQTKAMSIRHKHALDAAPTPTKKEFDDIFSADVKQEDDAWDTAGFM